MSKPMKAVAEAFAVILVGILESAVAWLLYVGIYLGLEALFFEANPTEFPPIKCGAQFPFCSF